MGKGRYGNFMKILIPAVASLMFLSGCNEIADIGKSRVERSKAAFEPCKAATVASVPQFNAASSHAVSPTYATEARANAETCADARRKLAVIDPGHECLPTATMAEAVFWALAASFEGGREIDSYNGPTVTSEQAITCQIAIGATPEEVAVMRREEAESQRQHQAVIAEAEAAMKAAEQAEAAVMRSLSGR
jgi:hypothetical protein